MAQGSAPYDKAREELDHYALLELTRDASQEDVRRNFLKLMRLNHPDKLPRAQRPSERPSDGTSTSRTDLGSPCSSSTTPPSSASDDLAQRLNEAYAVLSDIELRRAYDAELDNVKHKGEGVRREPRISAIVDLEAFEIFEPPDHGHGQVGRGEKEDEDEDRIAMRLPCRCGSFFVVTPHQIEQGLDLIECAGCSLVIRIASEGDEAG